VLIVFHDGPQAQFRPVFDPWIEYVVNTLGYAVVAPNLRGSSGYGRAYEAADDQLQRDDVIKDLGALIVWVGAQTGFDAKHVVVSGAGYGGFLALAALANYGDRLSGGVDLGGIGDFVTYAANGPRTREAARRSEFGDERDPDTRAFLRRISPLTIADRIGKPLFVAHGRNDARVPVAQSEQVAATLRSRGVEVWYLEARNEGYGFRKQPNRDAYFRAFAQFLLSLK
jgi:dipeptidyl aminopeptidase/acylaminoacyl peptidase